ncbi:MAG TPA: L-lactate permease [Chloroflexi bacterium]|nr:L-lactate permease [Chloroflexota bacterium]
MIPDWLLASLPILVILVLMTVFRWSAARAGSAGWLAAMLIAACLFGADLRLLAFAQAKAALLSLDVLLIVWNAFLLYKVIDEAGAIALFSQVIPGLTRDTAVQALLIGWAFASFLQGVGGFGVPTAVTAPLLVGLGFSPMAAVLIPSLGHAWAVTFGSLASSFQALMAATGLPGETLAPHSAVFLALAGLACGVLVAQVAGTWRGAWRALPAVLIMGIPMGLVQFTLATCGLWNIAALGAGSVGLACGVLATRLRLYRNHSPSPRAPGAWRQVGLALSGYLALVAITLVVQLTPAIRSALEVITLRVPFPELVTQRGYVTPAGYGRQIPLLRHAGALLAYSSLCAYAIYRLAGRYSPGALRRIAESTLRRMLPSSLGIAAMVAMAVVMAHAGMTDALAHALARGAGKLFPLASPWIGALGAFMTGSNTNSNVVFALLQLRTAELLGLSLPIILAAQTAGGAIGSVAAPTKIVVGASTTGAAGQEGRILGKLLGYVAALLAILSLAAWISLGRAS